MFVAPAQRLCCTQDLILDTLLERQLLGLCASYGKEPIPAAAKPALKTPDKAWIVPGQQPDGGGYVMSPSFNQKIGNLE